MQKVNIESTLKSNLTEKVNFTRNSWGFDLDSLVAFNYYLNAILEPFICIVLINPKIEVSHTKTLLNHLKLDHILYSYGYSQVYPFK